MSFVVLSFVVLCRLSFVVFYRRFIAAPNGSSRHFYKDTPLRALAKTEADIWAPEDEVQGILRDVVG